MGEAELDVADDVGVLNRLVARDPVLDGLVVGVVEVSRGLADVVAGGEELVVPVWRDPERLAGEGGALPNHAFRFGEEGRAVGVEDLVGHGLLGRGIEAARVDDVPGAARLGAVARGGLLGGAERRLLAVEAVAIHVLSGAQGGLRKHGVALQDGVVGAVDLGVDAQREDVLVVVGVDGWGNLGAEGGGGFAWVHAVGVEHAGQLHLELVGPVQGEGVVEGILVVGCRDDLGDDELPITGRDDSAVAVIGMLVKQAIVLLVNADGVFDNCRLARSGRHDSIHVMDDALAVTSKLQRVGHQTSAVLANIKGMLPVVRRVRVAVGHNHLNHTDAVEESALALLVVIVNTDIGEDDTLTVVEANVHLVAGPRNLIPIHLERDTFGLGNVNGL